MIFCGDGGAAGRLLVPINRQLLEIGSDYVLLVETDAFDIETVRLMRLVK